MRVGEAEITMGQHVTPNDTSQAPEVICTGFDEDALYSYVMTDPDTPFRFGVYLHWLVVDVKNGDVNSGEFSSCDKKVEYLDFLIPEFV